MKRLFAVLALVLVGFAPSAAHASVGTTQMKICNALLSTTPIYPSGDVDGLDPGQCGVYSNASGQLRVWIPGESYKYGQPGQGYGACKNAPWDSDPPNSANGSTETYRTYNGDGC